MAVARCLLLLLIALAGCGGGTPVVHRFGGETMGSTYEIKFVGDVAIAQVQKIVTDTLAEFDAVFSKWRDDSEIQRCNAAATTEPFAASQLFLSVLGQALELAVLTDGAFDPTVEPLLRVYRAAKATGGEIDEVALAAAGARVGYRHVAIDGGMIRRAKAGVELDLDGIVAGACIDTLASRLDAAGLCSYYLEVTGETFCRGEKAPGTPWRIGVVDPRSDLVGGNAAFTAVPLRDAALCTSGDYRNAILSGGELIHHVFDPRTGRSAATGVVSASVLAKSAARADGLGTALIVLGEQGAARLLERPAFGDVRVLLLLADGDRGVRDVKLRWPEEE